MHMYFLHRGLLAGYQLPYRSVQRAGGVRQNPRTIIDKSLVVDRPIQMLLHAQKTKTNTSLSLSLYIYIYIYYIYAENSLSLSLSPRLDLC